ncbi:MAG: response regulator [Pseudomonadales bacterium]
MPAESSGTRRNLLIVDDHGPTLRALTARFEHADYRVMPATNASIALGHLNEMKPDVALLDINMPGLDGFKLASELQRKVPDCKCFFISASKSQAQLEKAASMNLPILEKPFDGRELLAALESAHG